MNPYTRRYAVAIITLEDLRDAAEEIRVGGLVCPAYVWEGTKTALWEAEIEVERAREALRKYRE